MEPSADPRTKTQVAAPSTTPDSASAPTAPADDGATLIVDTTVVNNAKAKKDKHLYQIDFVRLFTFAAVVLDHVILSISTYGDLIAQGFGLLFRYTRYCFFALTGFVLTFQYRNRELHAPTFWRRRFKLIGLPFLTWSIFYWVFNRWRKGGWDNVFAAFGDLASARRAFESIGYDLVTGHAAYHLYFLSVSMQIYVVFPLVLWVLRRTWGYHRYLLALSGAFHIWLMYHMVRPPLDFFSGDGTGLAALPGVLWRYLGITLLPYQFFVLAGCLAAYHFEAFSAFMKRFRWPLSIAALITIAVTLVYYSDAVAGVPEMTDHKAGEEMVFRATNVFMVHNAFAFVGIIVLLWTGGVIWQNRRSAGSIADTVMTKAADRSFAIYLAHVVAIFAVAPSFSRDWDAALGWRIVVMYLVVCILTVFLVEVLRLSPLSLITTGRNRLDWRKQNPGMQLVVAISSIVIGMIVYLKTDDGIATFVVGTGILLLVGALTVLAKQLTSRTAA